MKHLVRDVAWDDIANEEVIEAITQGAGDAMMVSMMCLLRKGRSSLPGVPEGPVTDVRWEVVDLDLGEVENWCWTRHGCRMAVFGLGSGSGMQVRGVRNI